MLLYTGGGTGGLWDSKRAKKPLSSSASEASALMVGVLVDPLSQLLWVVVHGVPLYFIFCIHP